MAIVPFNWHFYKEISEPSQMADALGINVEEINDDMWDAFCSQMDKREVTIKCLWDTETMKVSIVSDVVVE